MNRKIAIVLLIALFLSAQFVFADDEEPDFAAEEETVTVIITDEEETVIVATEEEGYEVIEEDTIFAEAEDEPGFETVAEEPGYIITEEEPKVPDSIQNNEYYLESLRLAKLAQDTYEYGDYDASTGFAEDAIRYARLSDEYVADQLIIEAKRLLTWADENEIATKYPNDYNESTIYYEASLTAQADEEWDQAISSAINSIEIMSALEAGTPRRVVITSSTTLPKQYTVRTWASVRDCLWNIAGYSFVYGDPQRWKTLYEANKSKLPNPDNPDLVEPGTVIDIPSIKGETREGMWHP